MYLTPYGQVGGQIVYCDDCLHALPLMGPESADAIITDPPFAFAGGNSNGRSSSADNQFFEHWLVSVFRELYRVSRPTAAWWLWCDWRTATVYDSALAKAAPDYHEARWVSQVLIHDREMVGMGSPLRNQTDWIALIRGKKTDFRSRISNTQPNIIRSYWYYGKHEYHPSEKDPEIAMKLIEWSTDRCGVVLDPFAGGGATLVAARRVGRLGIGIEKETEYCATIMKRLTDEAAQQRLPEMPMEV